MSEYQQSAERCTEIVAGKVCRGCGGELKPLETVDNAGRPTFWPGCESCSRFDYGVSPEVFRIARELVVEGTLTPYTSSDTQDYKDSQDENKRCYWLTAQTSGAATAVQRVLKLSGAEAKLAKVREALLPDPSDERPVDPQWFMDQVRAILENQYG